MSERTYEFRVSGRLSDQVCDLVGDFAEMHIVPAPPETVIICSSVPDAAHLHGIVMLLHNLDLRILSLHQVRVLPGNAV